MPFLMGQNGPLGGAYFSTNVNTKIDNQSIPLREDFCRR